MTNKKTKNNIEKLKGFITIPEFLVNDEPFDMLLEKLVNKLEESNGNAVQPFNVEEVLYFNCMLFKNGTSITDTGIRRGSTDYIKMNAKAKLQSCVDKYVGFRDLLRKTHETSTIYSYNVFSKEEYNMLDTRSINYLSQLLAYTRDDITKVFGPAIASKVTSLQVDAYRKSMVTHEKGMQFIDDYFSDAKEKDLSFLKNEIGVTRYIANKLVNANYTRDTFSLIKDDDLEDIGITQARDNMKKIRKYYTKQRGNMFYVVNHTCNEDLIKSRNVRTIPFVEMFRILADIAKIIPQENTTSEDYQILFRTLSKLKESEAKSYLTVFSEKNNNCFDEKQIKKIIKLLKKENVFVDDLIEEEFVDYDFCNYDLIINSISHAKASKGLSSNEISMLVLGRCDNHLIDNVLRKDKKPSIYWLEQVCLILDINLDELVQKSKIEKRGSVYICRDIKNNDYSSIVVGDKESISDEEYAELMKSSALRKKCHEICKKEREEQVEYEVLNPDVENMEDVKELETVTKNVSIDDNIEFIDDEPTYYEQFSQKELYVEVYNSIQEKEENDKKINDCLEEIKKIDAGIAKQYAEIEQKIQLLLNRRFKLEEEIANYSASNYFCDETMDIIDEEISKRVRNKKRNNIN